MTDITSKDQTLLPCPFCGLRPNLIRAFNDPAWWIISCPHADCEVGPTIEREGQDAAIAAWNKRGTVETKSQVTVWGRPRWTVERPNDPCINCGCTRFICTGCIGASSEKASVRCTCFEDDHGPDCDIDGCCGQCTGQNGRDEA